MFESLFGASPFGGKPVGMINNHDKRDKKSKVDKIQKMKKRPSLADRIKDVGKIDQKKARREGKVETISPQKAKNLDELRKKDGITIQEIKEPEPKPEEEVKPDVVAPKIVCPICKSTFQYVVPEEEVKLQEDTGVGRITPPPDIQPQPLGDINPADVKNMEFATYAFSHMNGKERFGTLIFMFVAVGSAIYLYTR